VVTDSRNRTFIDGDEVSATKFNAAVQNVTCGSGTLLFNLFEFPNMHWSKQRDFILKHFADKVAYADTTDLTDELKRLQRDAATLPTRIEECFKQLEITPACEAAEVEGLLAQCTTRLAQIQGTPSRERILFLQGRVKSLSETRQDLLRRYRQVSTTCPTCGQRLPASKVENARAEIVAKGKIVAERLAQVRKELADAQSEADFNAERAVEIKTLQDKIRDLNNQLAAAKQGDTLRKRLSELRADEKKVNLRITELEGKIAAAQAQRRNQMRQSEDKVNAQFKFVKFKLFRFLKTTEEMRETCEPMIDGVPYSSLSNGEKFKAACDIMNALQSKFNIEMPLMIDNAESYTPNSYVELPNQLFLFKVADCDLKVEVQDD